MGVSRFDCFFGSKTFLPIDQAIFTSFCTAAQAPRLMFSPAAAQQEARKH
jgi:hypothetical protein